MITIFGPKSGRFCDGVSRRDFLRIGGLALGGLSMPQILRAEAQLARACAGAEQGNPEATVLFDDAITELRLVGSPYNLAYGLLDQAAHLGRTGDLDHAAAVVGCSAAVALLYASGAGWLMVLAHLSLNQGWAAGIAPFLSGEAIKILAAASIYSALARTSRN